jgi:acetylornithine deacetylase
VATVHSRTEHELTSVVDHLSQLIRIPSVSAIPNRSVTDYAGAVLTAQGWTIREIPYVDDSGIQKVNLIAAPPGQDVGEREVDLAFLCHTDTVPFASDWPAALEPALQGSSLHGCGSCDVKGFLACLLSAAEAKETRWRSGLRLVLTADEEIGCVGSGHLVAMDCLRPRRVVIGEPTSLHVARAGKGYCLARVTVEGREAHSAHPEQGLSAIYAASRVISAIEDLGHELKAEVHPFFHPGYTTLNVGMIRGGSGKNIIPGLADFLVEWRPIPAHSADGVSAAIQTAFERVQTQYPGIRTTLSMLRQQAGFETAASSSLVKWFENATGRAATSIAFGSEASVWSTIAEEVVVFGPGDMRSAHSERECVPIAELDIAVQTVSSLMQSS